jgi:hypothetical protein
MTEDLQSSPPTNDPPPQDPPANAPNDPPPADPPTNGRDQSLGAGGGGDDPPQAVPATWPEDWRERLAGDDETDLKTLRRWKDPANLWKQNKSLRSRMDSGEFRRNMPEGADEEALKAWRAEVGVPETPDGYKESLPKELEIEDDDVRFLDEYFNRMHARGVSTADVQEGVAAYYDMMAQAAEEVVGEDRTYRKTAEDELRSDWGPEYRANMNAIASLLSNHAPDGLREVLFSARGENGRLLGDNPQVLQFLADVSRQIDPYGTVTPAGDASVAQSIDDEIAKYELEMKDTKAREHDYWHNPVKQSRYRELLEMRDRYKR